MSITRSRADVRSTEAVPVSESEHRLHRPIFIAGAGRSGTTLLRSLLSAHSRVSISPETHFMQRAEQWGLSDREGPENFDQFWERFTSSVRFRDLGIEAEYCRELINHAENPTFRAIFEAVLVAYGRRVGKERIGEKTPGHVHFIPHLLSWFPDARVLILRRDPRAVVASQLRSPWVQERITPRSMKEGLVVGSYLHQVAYYADDWQRMYDEVVPASGQDGRVLVVQYEELVRRPEGEIRRICAFLDEAFEPAMLDGRSDENVPIPASTHDLNNEYWREWRKKHHAKTLRPISTQSLEKWRLQLSEREVAMIEGHCASRMQLAGYRPTLSASRRRAGRRMVKTLLSAERAEVSVRDLLQDGKTFARRVYRRIRRELGLL